MSTNPYLDAIGAAADEVANPYLDAIDNRKGRLRSAGAAFMRGGGVGVGQSVSGAVRGAEAAINPANLDFGRFSQSDFAEAVAAEQPAQAVRFRTPQEREQSLQQDPVYQAGAQLAEGAREAFQPNPRFAGEFWTDTIPGSAGQMLPTLAAGAVNPYLAVLQYGLSAGQGQAEEAVAAGQPDKAQAAFVAAAPLGAVTEAALGPIARMAKLAKLARTDGAGRAVLEAAAREAGQEGLEQVGGNLIASDVAGYDPNRPWRQGVGTAMAAGAVLGGALGGGLGAVAQQTRERVREQMGIESAPGDAQVMPDPSLDELPDYREADPAQAATDAAMARADAAGQQMRRTAEANPYLVEAGLAESVPAEGFTPIDQAVRQSRLGRMDPQAAVAEAVPAEGWTPVDRAVAFGRRTVRPLDPFPTDQGVGETVPAEGETAMDRMLRDRRQNKFREKAEAIRARRDAWINQTLDQAGERGSLEYVSTERPDRTLIVSPVPGQPGRWRTTQFDANVPIGHYEFDSREQAIRAVGGEHHTKKIAGPSYFGTGEYVLKRSKERYNIAADGRPLDPFPTDQGAGETVAPDAEWNVVGMGRKAVPEQSPEARLAKIKALPPAERNPSDVEWANNYTRQKVADEAAAAAAEAKLHKSKSPVSSFTVGMNKLNAAKAAAALELNVENRGRLIKRRELIEEMINGGGRIVLNPKGKRRLVREDGGYIEEAQLTKTGMDYAEFLMRERTGPGANSPEIPEISLTKPADVRPAEPGEQPAPPAEAAPAMQGGIDNLRFTSEPVERRRAGKGRPLVTDAKDAKAKLVAELEKAVAAAPTMADTERPAEKVTIEIPGDGTFTVFNTKENLRALLAKAKRLETGTAMPSKAPVARAPKMDVERVIEDARKVYGGRRAIEILRRQAADESLAIEPKDRALLEEAAVRLANSLPEIRLKAELDRIDQQIEAMSGRRTEFSAPEFDRRLRQFKLERRDLAKKLEEALAEAGVAKSSTSPTDKAIAALESLKVDTAGKVFDAIQGIPVAVWNGALSAAQLALRAGAKVADAITAALAHIRAQHRGDFDEAAVRAELENSLQQRQFAEQIDAAPDIAQPVKDATTNRFYTRKPNESTAAFAGRIIAGVGGPQNAVAVFTDSTNGLGGAERTMLGQLIVKQLSAAGQHEAAARFLDDTFLPYSTEAAQALQAFAAFANLTPEGALIYAKRLFNRAQRQPRERIQPTLDTAVDVLDDLNRQGIEGTVKDGQVQAEAGDTVTDAVVADGRKPGSRLQRAILTESADRMRRAILLYRGADSPRTILAKLTSRDGYWNSLVKGQQKSLTSALMLALGLKPQQQLLTGTVSQLAADLGRVLRQQAEATLARQRTPVTPRSARQQLLTLLLNSERMSEVWAGVRATLEAEGKTDPNVLRVLGTTMDVWSKPLLAQVAREYLKTADVNLAELVRNHYIEATDGRPQATLAAKIVDWLGVSDEAAKPLAAAFDGVLREEAEKVRAGLRKRIEAVKRDPRWKRTLASGIVDPENLPDTEVDAALMQAIREQRVQLGRLVREHFRTVDATGRSLAERVAAVAGVSPDRAKRLAAVVQARFAERVKAAKAAAIGRIEQVQPVPRELKQVWQRLVELSNLGALDRDTAWNAVAERLKLPQWTADIAKETQRLAQRVAETPEGITRQKRVIELHNYLARATGVPVMDTVLAFWYANTLSGPTTQAVNLLANVQNLLANLAIEARHPRDFVAQLAAVGRGLQQGGREAAEVLRTGILTRPGNTKLAASRPLELLQLPGRLDYLLTPFRLVGRALAAGDSLFFHAGQESRAVLLARQMARSEGLSGPALQRRVAEALGRSSRQRFRAVRQALREGLSGVDLARRVDDLTLQQRPEGINDNARDYALRLTFNQKPYGLLGAIAHGINWAGAQPFGLPLRLVVPFTNVVANVANESLNYVPPIGVARAVWGQWKGTLEGQPITDRNALGDQWAKAALGTVLLGMVWAAAEGGLDEEDPWFMVNGAGPRESSKKNQLRATGWIPFSLKVGNRYVSFANSPVAMPMAAIGNYFDARRYRQLDEQDAWNRIAYAFTTMGKVILEQSFLDGIARIVGTLDRDNVNAGKELAQSIGRTAGNFVIPNAVRQVDRLFDPTVYDAPTTESALINSVPYARRLNRPALNVWGEPVRNELTKRFASTPTDDPLLAVLSRRGLWISAPNRTQTEHLNGQPMTPDEFYEFTKVRGQALKRLASRPGTAEALQNLPEEQAQRLWRRLQTTATRQAKAKVRPSR